MNLEVAVEKIVAALEAREDELVDRMLERNVAEVPDLGLARDEPAVLATYRASARANLRAGLAMLSDSVAAGSGGIAGGGGLPSVALPADALREARESARARVPLEALLRTYRIGHAVTWEALIDEVDGVVSASADRHALLHLLNRCTFGYVDAVLPLVADEYEAEGRRQLRHLDQRRLDAVLAVLSGAAVDVGELKYDVSGWHLGLIAWGDQPEAAAQTIASRLERPVLCVRAAEGTAWAWIGGRGRFSPEAWDRIAGARLGQRVNVALGNGLQGLEGFRRTHRQARDTQHIAMALRNRMTRYADIAVEALTLRDREAARSFVDEMLGALDEARNPDVLMETLATYLQHGLNASAAAKSLGINDRTVAYRLKVVEDVTGHSLAAHRFEFEAALRLERILRNSP